MVVKTRQVTLVLLQLYRLHVRIHWQWIQYKVKAHESAEQVKVKATSCTAPSGEAWIFSFPCTKIVDSRPDSFLDLCEAPAPDLHPLLAKVEENIESARLAAASLPAWLVF